MSTESSSVHSLGANSEYLAAAENTVAFSLIDDLVSSKKLAAAEGAEIKVGIALYDLGATSRSVLTTAMCVPCFFFSSGPLPPPLRGTGHDDGQGEVSDQAGQGPHQ